MVPVPSMPWSQSDWKSYALARSAGFRPRAGGGGASAGSMADTGRYRDRPVTPRTTSWSAGGHDRIGRRRVVHDARARVLVGVDAEPQEGAQVGGRAADDQARALRGHRHDVQARRVQRRRDARDGLVGRRRSERRSRPRSGSGGSRERRDRPCAARYAVRRRRGHARARTRLTSTRSAGSAEPRFVGCERRWRHRDRGPGPRPSSRARAGSPRADRPEEARRACPPRERDGVNRGRVHWTTSSVGQVKLLMTESAAERPASRMGTARSLPFCVTVTSTGVMTVAATVIWPSVPATDATLKSVDGPWEESSDAAEQTADRRPVAQDRGCRAAPAPGQSSVV